MTTENEFTYQPGICNIDRKGVEVRKKLGYLCILGFVIELVLQHFIEMGPVIRFAVGGVFGYIIAINFLQAREQFCVMNAAKNTYEVGLRKVFIGNSPKRGLDQKKMRSMITRCLCFSLIGGAVALIPL
ncbi:MAG: hypothetical protein WCH46_09160 [bacterium]